MKKDNSLKKTAAICTAAAIIVLLCIVLFLCIRKSAEGKAPEPLKTYEVTLGKTEETPTGENEEKNGEYLVFTDENGQSINVDGEDYMTNLAQDRYIIVKGRELVYFENDEMAPLSQNCISCTISNDGSTVAYITPNSDEKLYEGTLYLYDTVTGETTEVCNTCFVSTSGRIQLSPDGDTVSYTKDYDEETLTYDCCYYRKGKETVIGQNRDVLAISDNADYIYYAIEDPENYTSILAVYTKDKGEVILDEAFRMSMYLNLDYSECVFYKGEDTEKLYISRKGSEGELYKENAAELDTSSLVPHVNAVLNVETFG